MLTLTLTLTFMSQNVNRFSKTCTAVKLINGRTCARTTSKQTAQKIAASKICQKIAIDETNTANFAFLHVVSEPRKATNRNYRPTLQFNLLGLQHWPSL